MDAKVVSILKAAGDERRADCEALVAMMRRATGAEPQAWGSMIGFGDHHYRYESGREGDTFVLGFAPRKKEIVLYFTAGRDDKAAAALGKVKLGKSCVYLSRLADVDVKALQALLDKSARQVSKVRA